MILNCIYQKKTRICTYKRTCAVQTRRDQGPTVLLGSRIHTQAKSTYIPLNVKENMLLIAERRVTLRS